MTRGRQRPAAPLIAAAIAVAVVAAILVWLVDGSSSSQRTPTAPRAAVSAPTSIAFPRPGGSTAENGVFADGWTTRHSAFLLAGGAAAALAITGEVPAMPSQHLRIAVGGSPVFDDTVSPGRIDLHVPLAPSPGNRHIEIDFAHAIHLAPPDTRRASAQLASLRIVSLTAPGTLRFAESRSTVAGIYPDGWARRDARFAIGGHGSSLRVTLQNLIEGQTARFVVDGRHYASRPVHVGTTTFVLPSPPSDRARVVEIRFAKVAPISTNDQRPAAALLKVAATS